MRPAKDIPTKPLLVDEREAARLLGVSPRKMWQLSASGEIATVRIGRAKRYDVADLERFVADNKTDGAG